MKKYFMKGTQDEVQFGDMLELDFTKDTKNGTIHRHLETKFIPELVDILVEEGVIEVKTCTDKQNNTAESIKFNVDEISKQNLGKDARIAQLEKRVTELEGLVSEIIDSLENE